MSRKINQNPELEQRVDELFRQIADLDTASAIEFLKTVAAPQEVLDRVKALVEADSDIDSAHDVDQDASSARHRPGRHQLGSQADFEHILAPARPSPDLSGLTLEGLNFLQRLGSGGMGDVYLAEDTRLQRHVAVKVILDTFRFEQRAKERFRREAQILSQLDHSGICRIFNLIEAETQDFLVLEYVDGVTLRNWLGEMPSYRRRMDVAQALTSALAAAHEQGIVHRDLKPDNIMILADDQIKVLDFGISKYLSAALDADDEPLHDPASSLPKSDMHKTMPGVMLGTLKFMSPEQANGQPVGTASDIYSLGILFQLLFSEPQPGKPGNDGQQASSGAPIRGVSKELQRLMERMKMVAPAARPTAVEATSALQRIRQQPQRRLRLMLIAALVVVALLAGTKYTLDLRHEREQADTARLEAEQVSDFLINLFNVSDPEESKGAVITARELLDEGSEQIDRELAAHPAVRARLKTTMGRVYLKLGLYEPARQQLELSLAIADANGQQNTAGYAETLSALGNLETEANDYAAAESWFQQAEQAYTQSSGLNTKALLDIKDGFAMIYARTDRLDQALALNQEVLTAHLAAAEPVLRDIVNAYNNIGIQYWRKEQLQLAEDHIRLALASLQQAEQEDLALEATVMGNLALVLADQGELLESAEMAQTTVHIREQMYGGGHPNLALAYDNLAVSQFKAGMMDEAEVSNLKALELYAATQGKDHSNYGWALANRAVVLREKGDLDGSVQTLLEVIEIMGAALGASHTMVAENQTKLSTVYLLQNKPADALRLSEAAVATYKASQIEMSPFVSRSWSQLAHLQQQTGDIVAARQTLEDLLARIEMVADMDPAIAEQANLTLQELNDTRIQVSKD